MDSVHSYHLISSLVLLISLLQCNYGFSVQSALFVLGRVYDGEEHLIEETARFSSWSRLRFNVAA